ncbi:MAG: sugar ABC transporter permease [Propionibacteriaceae bacterium]|nr:sugar ABC transporter permease [Propionibacteriaceae bacterium]
MAAHQPAKAKPRRAAWAPGYVFITPTTVLLTLFYLYPLVRTIIYSFTNWNPAGFRAPHGVGFTNYINLFHDDTFLMAFRTTLIFVVIVVPVAMASGLLLAALMRTPLRGRTALRTLIFLPFIAPTVGSALIFTYLATPFGGLFNIPVRLFGHAAIPFLTTAPWSLVAVIIFSIWTQVGYTMIIYSSAMSVIPTSYYEAATMDGANSFRQFFYLTVPLVNPTTAFLSVTGTLTALQAFTQIQILTRGGPTGQSTTLLYWVYQQGFVTFNGGAATAGAVVLLVIGLIVATVQLRFFGRREPVDLQ